MTESRPTKSISPIKSILAENKWKFHIYIYILCIFIFHLSIYLFTSLSTFISSHISGPWRRIIHRDASYAIRMLLLILYKLPKIFNSWNQLITPHARTLEGEKDKRERERKRERQMGFHRCEPWANFNWLKTHETETNLAYKHF